VADICSLFLRLVVLLRRMIHTTPIAVIKQNAPPAAAPTIMLGFVLADSPPELELKLFALIVLDAVFSSAVSPRDHIHRGKCLHAKLKKHVLDLFRVFAWNHYICVDELPSMIPSYMTAKLTQN
jgi:hypothetical protein